MRIESALLVQNYRNRVENCCTELVSPREVAISAQQTNEQQIVYLESLHVWIGKLVNVEDWAHGQGFTPFPSLKPPPLKRLEKIEYPKLKKADLCRWAVDRAVVPPEALKGAPSGSSSSGGGSSRGGY